MINPSTKCVRILGDALRFEIRPWSRCSVFATISITFKVLHIDSALSSEGLSNHQPTVILKKSVTGKKTDKEYKAIKATKHQNGEMATCVRLSPQCKNTVGFSMACFL